MQSVRVLLTAQIDPILLPFLNAADPREEAVALARLNAEQIEPIVRRGIRYKLRFYRPQSDLSLHRPEFDEIYNDIQVRLLKRLRNLKAYPDEHQIANLSSYVATVTRNTCDEYLRQKYPLRRSLKDKVRRHLLTYPEFSLWEDADHNWLAGFSNWTNGDGAHTSGTAVAVLREQLQARWETIDVQRLELHELLTNIFEVAHAPLELDQLTALIAGFWQIEDKPAESLDAEASASGRQAAAETHPATIIEQRELLRLLWREICQLPRRQRVALLLNLKNPHGINTVTLLPATGIATFEQLAEALEIPLPEFEKLWADLPLDDLRLAEYLGATRQQVINLRKTARERLAKRMSALR